MSPTDFIFCPEDSGLLSAIESFAIKQNDPQKADPKAVVVATFRHLYVEGKIMVCFASHPAWHGTFDPDVYFDSLTSQCSVSTMVYRRQILSQTSKRSRRSEHTTLQQTHSFNPTTLLRSKLGTECIQQCRIIPQIVPNAHLFRAPWPMCALSGPLPVLLKESR
jgi:hypothetical protein